MKRSATIYGIILPGLLVLMNACCKSGSYQLAGVELTYQSVATTSNVLDIRTQKGNTGTPIDTIIIGELNEANNFSFFFDFDNGEHDHILQVQNTSISDTLTDITIERNRCDKIKKIQYKLNGTQYDLDKITIE